MRILLLILIFSSNLWAYGYNPVNEEIIVLEQAYRDLLNEYAQKKHKYESEKRKRDLLYLELKKCKSDCLDINNEIKKIEKGLPILKWYVDDYKQRKLKEYFSKRESLDYKKQISAKAITLLRELQYDRSPKNIQNAKNFLTSINGHENESTQKLVNFLKDHCELKRDSIVNPDENLCQKNQKNCWITLNKKKYFKTDYNALISNHCNEKNLGIEWKSFLEKIKTGFTKINNCFSTIAPIRAQTLLRKIEKNKVRVECLLTRSPQIAKSELGGLKEVETCGYESRDGSITLFSIEKCKDISKSVFHELLHYDSTIDNFKVSTHNGSSKCRPYDRVYSCVEACFLHDDLKKIAESNKARNWNQVYVPQMNNFGCNACMSLDYDTNNPEEKFWIETNYSIFCEEAFTGQKSQKILGSQSEYQNCLK